MVWMLLVLYFMEDVGDLVGVVEDVGFGAEVCELLVSAYLDGSGGLAGGFGFDEPDVSSGEDDESVGDACCAWAGEFPAEASCVFYGLFECFFGFLFDSHVRTFCGRVGTKSDAFLTRW